MNFSSCLLCCCSLLCCCCCCCCCLLSYTWLLANDSVPAGLELLGCKYERAPVPSRSMVGSGGWDQFAFRATQTGSVQVELQKVRPWMPRPAEMDAKFTVNVQAAGQDE
jgi:predicted secreted protein